MEKQIAELKSLITKIAAEVSKIKLDAADTRIHLKSTMGDLNRLSGQVQNLDQQIEASHKKTEAQAQQQVTTEAAKKMNLTEIGDLYRKDPAKAAQVLREQGMNPSAGHGGLNPWVFHNRKEQELLEKIDPAKAAELKAQAASIRR